MSARKPAFLSSDAVGEVVAAALWDYASHLDTPGNGPTTASIARLCRRSARELLALHNLTEDEVRKLLIDTPAPESGSY